MLCNETNKIRNLKIFDKSRWIDRTLSSSKSMNSIIIFTRFAEGKDCNFYKNTQEKILKTN